MNGRASIMRNESWALALSGLVTRADRSNSTSARNVAPAPDRANEQEYRE